MRLIDYEEHADGVVSEIRRVIDAVVALPDKQANLFVTLCLQNHGRLSPSQKTRHFARLTDKEVALLEKVVQAHMGSIRSALLPRGGRSGYSVRRTGHRRNRS